MKLTLLSLLFAASVAQAAPPPISAFFNRPAVREPKLSPSGRYLAVQAAGKDDRMWLAVLDLETRQAPQFIAGFNDADVSAHHWIGEDRLVFHISNSPDGTTRVSGQGLWAVDRDGSNFRQLIKSDNGMTSKATTLVVDRRPESNWELHRAPAALDGGEITVLRRLLRRFWSTERESTGVQLARLDTRTGFTRTLSEGIPCRTTSPTPWPGPSSRAGPTPSALASWAPAMAATRR